MNLDEEPQASSPINVSPPHSPIHYPVHNLEGSSSRRYPGIDPTQQEIYEYIESLERRNAVVNPSMQEQPISPEDPLVSTLNHEIYELELLNSHTKQENEALE